uniref:Kinesin motor domain-containing protein n=1 Tax=Rhabditophanes sp. KR3021 TaxID=114890 RepID=A0AC35UAA8_9BILA
MSSVFKTPKLPSSAKKNKALSRSTSEKNLHAEEYKQKTPKRSLNYLDISSLNGRKRQDTLSNIQVSLRIKFSKNTLSEEGIEIESGETDILKIEHASKYMAFEFANIFKEEDSQEMVYNGTAKRLVQEAIEGFSVCVFAYGQTGSGKTYSISGNNENTGLLPRFCFDLFDKLSVSGGTMEACYYEVYNEKVFDLLSDNKIPLKIRGTDAAYISNLTWIGVRKIEDLNYIREEASLKRATTSTAMNERSSRSHAVFCLRIRQNLLLESAETGGKTSSPMISNCYFVDLAGSEKADDVSNDHMEETKNINKSLSFLKSVIFASAESKDYIGFRDSVLTRLLKECFGGNCKTVLLATIAPDVKHRSVSLSTLRFASKAALVEQKPFVGADLLAMRFKELMEENQVLKKQINNDSRLSSDDRKVGVVDYIQPNVPCYVALNSDSALCYWKSIEGITEFGLAGASGSYYVIFKNGELLEANSTYLLKHGDRVVIGGQHFLLMVLANDGGEKDLFTFEEAKLEHATSIISTKYKHEMEEEKKKFEGSAKQLQDELKKEIEDTRFLYEEKLKNVMVIEARTRQEAAEKCKDLLDELAVKQQFQRDLEEAYMKLETDFHSSILKQEDPLTIEGRALCNMAKYDVKMTNILLQQCQKHQIFAFCLIQKDLNYNFIIHLKNIKEEMFAELSFGEFQAVKYHLFDAYASSGSDKKFADRFESIFYSHNYPWKKRQVMMESGLLSVAVCNSLDENVFNGDYLITIEGYISEIMEYTKNFISCITSSKLDLQKKIPLASIEDKLNELMVQFGSYSSCRKVSGKELYECVERSNYFLMGFKDGIEEFDRMMDSSMAFTILNSHGAFEIVKDLKVIINYARSELVNDEESDFSPYFLEAISGIMNLQRMLFTNLSSVTGSLVYQAMDLLESFTELVSDDSNCESFQEIIKGLEQVIENIKEKQQKKKSSANVIKEQTN